MIRSRLIPSGSRNLFGWRFALRRRTVPIIAERHGPQAELILGLTKRLMRRTHVAPRLDQLIRSARYQRHALLADRDRLLRSSPSFDQRNRQA